MQNSNDLPGSELNKNPHTKTSQDQDVELSNMPDVKKTKAAGSAATEAVNPSSQTDNSPSDSPIDVILANKLKALEDQLVPLKEAEEARKAAKNLPEDKCCINDLVPAIVITLAILIFAIANFLCNHDDHDAFNKVNDVVMATVLMTIAIATGRSFTSKDDLLYQRRLKYVLFFAGVLCFVVQLAPLIYDLSTGKIPLGN